MQRDFTPKEKLEGERTALRRGSTWRWETAGIFAHLVVLHDRIALSKKMPVDGPSLSTQSFFASRLPADPMEEFPSGPTSVKRSCGSAAVDMWGC